MLRKTGARNGIVKLVSRVSRNRKTFICNILHGNRKPGNYHGFYSKRFVSAFFLDHLLSYFLGGDQNQNGVTNPQAQLTTTPALVASALPSDSIQSGPLNDFPYATAMRLNNQRSFSSGREANNFDDDIVPPPTLSLIHI